MATIEQSTVIVDSVSAQLVDCTPSEPVSVRVPVPEPAPDDTPVEQAQIATVEQTGADPPPPRFWEKPERKTLFTLNVGDYASAITDLTYPLLRAWARRMGAAFHVITDRRFPDWPVTYEKLQLYELAQAQANDWNLYVDSDALVHPDTPDFTVFLRKDTVAHNGADLAPIRWTYDRFFRRDGRHIGSGNWLAIASDWCLELWKPLDDLTCAEAVARIQPAEFETRAGITPDHLIDDFVLSRNIAKYGLKFTTVRDLQTQWTGMQGMDFLRHDYLLPTAKKVDWMRHVLKDEWKLI